MQINQFRAEVHAEGFSDQASFAIDASGKAFKGLIDGIYSRKLEAIVRELSTNAFDAQIDAAYIGPFDVHLPTTLSPVFWIRDFGTGMSHEQVMTRYTRMFNSTKDGAVKSDYKATTASAIAKEANKQVGCLGLGSKAFFAYTDACTLIVWQGGEKRVYSVFMGGDGVPQVALAGIVESDEPNGVRVEFAVKNKDLNEFSKAATRVYKGFPYIPNGLGPYSLNALQIKPTMIGDGWKAYPEDYLPESAFYAKQGCVLYPIDLAQLDSRAIEGADGEIVLSTIFEQYKKTTNTIILEFPIGSINFDLSRERLAYDEDTVKALRGSWDRFSKDISQTLSKHFANVKNGYDIAMLAREEKANSFGPLFSLTPAAMQIEAVSEALNNAFPQYSHNYGCMLVTCYKLQDGELKTFRNRSSHGAPKKKDMLGSLYMYADESIKSLRARIIQHMKENDFKHAFVFGSKKLTVANMRKIGNPPVVRYSELPDLPKEVKERLALRGGGGSFNRFKRLLPNGTPSGMGADEVAELDPEKTFYALINRGRMEHYPEDPTFTLSSLGNLNLLLKHLGAGEVVLINTRSNESGDRWPEAVYPRWTEAITRLLDYVTPEHLREFANVFNHEQYHASFYPEAVSTYRRRMGKKASNPLVALERFDNRYKKQDRQVKALWSIILKFANTQSINSYYCENSFDKIVYNFIDMCREIKEELLPPILLAKNRGAKSKHHFGIIPNKWHRLAKQLNEPSTDRITAFYQKQVIKDFHASC